MAFNAHCSGVDDCLSATIRYKNSGDSDSYCDIKIKGFATETAGGQVTYKATVTYNQYGNLKCSGDTTLGGSAEHAAIKFAS